MSCQIQDVRREMAAFIPILQSETRHGERCFSVAAQANTLHEATDLSDTDCLLRHQVFSLLSLLVCFTN